MKYLNYRKSAQEILESNIDSKAIKAIRQIMKRGLDEANQSYNASTSYIERHRTKSFSYELHKTLVKIFDEDPIGKHIGVSTGVKRLQGIYSRLEVECGNLIVSVVKAKKDSLPIKSDYKSLLSKKNICLSNQLVFGLDYKKEDLISDKYYVFLTYDLAHNNQEKISNYKYLDLIVPDHEYKTILYTEPILRPSTHLREIEIKKLKDKNNIVARKPLFEVKRVSDRIE